MVFSPGVFGMCVYLSTLWGLGVFRTRGWGGVVRASGVCSFSKFCERGLGGASKSVVLSPSTAVRSGLKAGVEGACTGGEGCNSRGDLFSVCVDRFLSRGCEF